MIGCPGKKSKQIIIKKYNTCYTLFTPTHKGPYQLSKSL